MKRTTKIVEKKFRDGDTVGMCHQDTGLIEIEPRQLARDYLTTLLHELLHREFPDLREEAVEWASVRMGDAVWGQGFRKLAD